MSDQRIGLEFLLGATDENPPKQEDLQALAEVCGLLGVKDTKALIGAVGQEISRQQEREETVDRFLQEITEMMQVTGLEEKYQQNLSAKDREIEEQSNPFYRPIDSSTKPDTQEK